MTVRRLGVAVLALMVAGCPGARTRPAPTSVAISPPDDSPGGGEVRAKVAVEDVEVETADRRKRKPRAGKGDAEVAMADARAEPEPEPRAAGESLAGIDLSDAQRDAVVSPRLARGESYLSAADPDRAIAEAMAVLEVQSDNIEAALLLARAYVTKGWLTKAEQILTVASRYPDGARNPRLWMLLGLVNERSGNPLESARDAYLKATKRKPNYAKAWNNLCAVEVKLEEYDVAISACESALAIDSNAVRALTNAGTAYRRQASVIAHDVARRDLLLRDAERSYRAAIALDEEHGPAYLNLGILLLDSDPFPGMDTLSRLQTSVRYLREFKRRGWSGEEGAAAAAAIDGYLEAAQKQVDTLIRSEQARFKVDFQRMVRERSGELRACYERTLGVKPGAEGKVIVKITIAGSGRVSSATVVSSTVGHATLETCVTDRIRGWSFPSSGGTAATDVVYPFVFTKEE